MMDKIKKFINVKTIFAASVVSMLIIFAIISSIVDSKSVKQAYEEFDGSIFSSIENSLIVESKTNPNVSVKYSSSNPSVLDFNYNVVSINRPESTQPDAEFIITVTFSKGIHTLSKEYDAVVINDDYEVSTISEVKQSNENSLVKIKNVVIAGKDLYGYVVTDGTDYMYVSHVAGYLTVGTVLDIRAQVSIVNDKVVVGNVNSVTTITGQTVSYSSTSKTVAEVTSLLSTNQDAYSFYKFTNVNLCADITFIDNKLVYLYYIKDGASKLYISSSNLSTLNNNLKSKLGLTDATVKTEFEGQTDDYVLTKTVSVESIELFLSSYDNGVWSALYCLSQF